MPSVCIPVVANGKLVGFACSRTVRRSCSSPGCHNDAPLLCDHPVTRKGKPGTCDRAICRSCAVNVGPNNDLCAAHARLRNQEKSP